MSDQSLLPVMSSDEMDRLGRTLISLAKEVWVLHDRQRIMEERLGELGLDLQLDSYSPPPALVGLLDAERDQFVAQLVDSLAGRGPGSAASNTDDPTASHD